MVVEVTVPSAFLMSVHVLPSAEYWAVKASPVRVSLTHWAVGRPAWVALPQVAAVVRRQPKETPCAGVETT
jgi:hypothetical protein